MENKTNPTTTPDLFSNPAILTALKGMTVEQRARYKVLGEEMFGSLNFTDGRIMNTMDTPKEEQAWYIAEGIKSGLHPSYLENNEKEILEEVYGKYWYKSFGYTKKDLRHI